MFGNDFYPTPPAVIEMMTTGETLEGSICFEPSAGKGNIVTFLKERGASVIACENNKDLRKILEQHCPVIADDFLTVTSDKVSHVTHIFMNPPFSADEKHILHAWEIAPAGCVIVALCNYNTIKNTYTKSREQLKALIDSYGRSEELGQVFEKSERSTGVEVGLIRLQKSGTSDKQEWEGFFMEEEPEEAGSYGIMSYNIVRDLVQRYVQAVKIFDKQLTAASEMHSTISTFFKADIAMSIHADKVPVTRNEFKKNLQKSAWNWIFEQMNLGKNTTQGLKADLNKFVEQNEKIPFTMRNIYQMLSVVIGTTGSRMDKAICEVFDRVTETYKENRYNLEGWKTNSHYLLTRRFIVGDCIEMSSGPKMRHGRHHAEMIEDLTKALCYITGSNYSNMTSLDNFLRYPHHAVDEKGNFLNKPGYNFDVKLSEHDYQLPYLKEIIKTMPGASILTREVEFGQWFDWGFFRARAYKKGTLHLEFKSEDTWALFNQRVAKLKGYPLPEKVNKTKAQPQQKTTTSTAILFEI